MKKLDPKVKLAWSLLRIIISILLVLAYVLLICFVPEVENVNTLLIIHGVCLPIVILFIIYTILYPQLRYKFYSYSYDDKTIRINHGIIYRYRDVIPVCQIQDLHIEQSPLMLLFKLSSIIISTAGSNYSLDGLSAEEAEKMVEDMREKLEKRIEEQRYEEIQ